jgi:hypothetical protein
MGQASQTIIIILAINLFMAIIALSIQSVDPTSNLLLSNKLFGTAGVSTDNNVVSSLNNASGVYTYDWNNTQYDNLGASGSSIVSTSSSAFPDWIRSGWSFATTTGRTYINLVGAPYTIVSGLGIDSELSALIGAFFGLVMTFIILNWLLGRET